MKNFFTLLIVLLYNVFLQNSLASHPLQDNKTPAQLSKILLEIYHDHRMTFFCDQPFSRTGEILISPCLDCPPLSVQVQWMPIVPFQQLANFLPCAQEKMCINTKGERFKGLRCCQQRDPLYQQMSRDLHNFVPESPALKQLRRGLHFGELTRHKQSDSCHFYMDKKQKMMDPAPKLKGMIARTYLYIKDRYHLPLPPEETQLYLKWHHEYPVSLFEKERNERIRKIQGNGNPYVN